ncbi:unnamed protein product [Owenia fusiformis]|uniref:Epidermal retinol dehydrogenase 2 n=1 Tax=Owenia fusiformis TaxID=6347 RepID=A0A8S4N3L2_OWEFU|nr:unnamed protein product [Owenia fusiformis]
MEVSEILLTILESVVFIVKSLYFVLEAIVLKFVPVSYRAKDVSGETVLVTGAGSGLGRLMSIRFAKLGCRLVLWDINKAGLDETANAVKQHGAISYTYVCDLSSRDDIYTAADKVKQEVGSVDILVNNAGIVTGKKFLDCPDSLIQKTMEVNTSAHFWTCKAFLPAMLDKNHGHIVNVASSAGLVGVNGLADYCASKFAAVGFDESLRYEFIAQGKTGVHTTVVCPYYINTGMFTGVKTKFPRILPIVEPEDAVDRIMNAVLVNQHIVMIPGILYLFMALKGLIPTKAGLLFAEHFGINNCMDDFTGRQKQE